MWRTDVTAGRLNGQVAIRGSSFLDAEHPKVRRQARDSWCRPLGRRASSRLGVLPPRALARVQVVRRVESPLEPQLRGIYGTIFTGPPSAPGADPRNVMIFADAEVDRSPSGTGTRAVMAVLAAMGVFGETHTFTHESIVGTIFRGRIAARTAIGDLPAIVPEIEGEAYIPGETTFLIDDEDPLRHGFRL